MEHFVCTTCRKHQGEQDVRLRQCGQCLSQLYCSRECRLADWPKHKMVCDASTDGRRFSVASIASLTSVEEHAILNEEPVSPTTIRPARGHHARGFSVASVDLARNSISLHGQIVYGNETKHVDPTKIDPNVIYYIKTKKPHAHDMQICGPYHGANVIRKQMLRRIAKYSHAAYSAWIKAFPETPEGEEQPGIVHWTTIRGPLNDNPFQEIVFELVCEQNAVVAASLPAPTYRILFLQHKQLGGRKTEKFSDTFEFSALQEIELLATVMTKNEAEVSARSLLATKMEEHGPGCMEFIGWESNSFHCFIARGREVLATIQASYDSGGVGLCSGTGIPLNGEITKPEPPVAPPMMPSAAMMMTPSMMNGMYPMPSAIPPGRRESIVPPGRRPSLVVTRF